MFTGIRAITDSNKQEVLNLKVAAQQRGFIESVSQCLLEAEQDTRYVPLALYKENKIIGFSMYGKFDEQIWLDRFLVDERFQQQGLGRYFFCVLVDYLTELYPKKPIYLSVFEQNKVAIRLYQKLGFGFTEEVDENGEKIMIYPH
ncbi:GNAT family N-acetyltransferase [Planococcus sp. ANT_H30]|uniref:Spermidine acetyltransferase n=2 Tax=Caryophanaceae TaxID=186818 RepID=A0ABM5X0Q4_9BACL|nr:GNAT family N-acetyltransferase [Planococcus kocurii]ALS80200.1 spermidine acetyltransferase [Planococcus kocurii]KAA0956297.1 GNAT family N-acetyltransferase [Planococcus sp. ANT_H30]